MRYEIDESTNSQTDKKVTRYITVYKPWKQAVHHSGAASDLVLLSVAKSARQFGHAMLI